MTGEDNRYSHRIWRALDAESSFFGIRGRYLLLYGIIAAAGTAASLPVWQVCGSLTGMVITAAVLIADYFTITAMQSQLTERQFTRMLGKLKMQRFSRVRPARLEDRLDNGFRWR